MPKGWHRIFYHKHSMPHGRLWQVPNRSRGI